MSNNTKVPIFLIGNKSDKLSDDAAYEVAEKALNVSSNLHQFILGKLILYNN